MQALKREYVSSYGLCDDRPRCISWLAGISWGHFKTLNRPCFGSENPLNLSISVSGGKETNKDSLSRCDRKGRSPARSLQGGSFRRLSGPDRGAAYGRTPEVRTWPLKFAIESMLAGQRGCEPRPGGQRSGLTEISLESGCSVMQP